MQLIPTNDYIKRIAENKTGENVLKIEPFFASEKFLTGGMFIFPQSNVFYFINYFSAGNGYLNFYLNDNLICQNSDSNNNSYIFCNGVGLDGVTDRSFELIGWKITTVSAGALLPVTDLVQYGKTLRGTVFSDKMLFSDIDLVDSNGVEFNGIDNFMQIADDITPFNSDWSININMKMNDYIGRGGIVAYSGISRNFLLGNAGANSVYIQYVADNGQVISQPIITGSDTDWHNYIIEWSAGTKTLVVYLDDNLIGSWTNALMDNIVGTQNTYLGRRSNLEFQHISVANMVSEACDVPFSLGGGNKVYCVNTDTEYTILGTVNASTHILQNKYHYNLFNGFSDITGVKYPASKLNIGKSVLGNDLTNPAITSCLGHNAAETGYKQKNVQALKDSDINNFWFDGSGVALTKYFADLVSNGNNIFCNVKDVNNDKRDLLLYSTEQTAAQQTLIQNYFDSL